MQVELLALSMARATPLPSPVLVDCMPTHQREAVPEGFEPQFQTCQPGFLLPPPMTSPYAFVDMSKDHGRG